MTDKIAYYLARIITGFNHSMYPLKNRPLVKSHRKPCNELNKQLSMNKFHANLTKINERITIKKFPQLKNHKIPTVPLMSQTYTSNSSSRTLYLGTIPWILRPVYVYVLWMQEKAFDCCKWLQLFIKPRSPKTPSLIRSSGS